MTDPGQNPINDCWNRIGVHGDSSCPELAVHIHCHNCPVFMRAATQLLDRSVPEDYLRERTAMAAMPPTTAECARENALVFRIRTEWMALSAKVCQEVSPNLRPHTIPFRRDGFVLGLVNVRGELVISVSLERVLGIPSLAREDFSESQHLVIIQKNNCRFAFPAREVTGFRSVLPSEIRPVPATLSGSEARYVKGIFGERSENIGLLDDDLLFYSLGNGLT